MSSSVCSRAIPHLLESFHFFPSSQHIAISIPSNGAIVHPLNRPNRVASRYSWEVGFLAYKLRLAYTYHGQREEQSLKLAHEHPLYCIVLYCIVLYSNIYIALLTAKPNRNAFNCN